MSTGITGELLTKADGKKKASLVYWQQKEIWITWTSNSGDAVSNGKNMKLYWTPQTVSKEEGVVEQGLFKLHSWAVSVME